MFPNVRLMIAAMVASVVALSCGFGVFAAFRVNHEPLVRLPRATAPLQLLADNTITASVVVAAAGPFDHRFQISQPQSTGRATDPPRQRDDRDGVESAPAASAAVPERDAAEPEEPAAVAQSIESAVVPAAAPAVPVAPPTAAPIANTVTPTMDDHALGATEPALGATEPAPAAAHADAASSSQETPAAAALDPPTDQALPVEQKPDSTLAPASVTKAARDVAHKPARKAAVSRTRRTRVVVWEYRSRGPRANAVAQFDTPYLNQDTAFSQPNFQTAPQAPQTRLAQRQHRRSKDSSRPPEDTTSVAGGTFVSPPSR
jgi:hypothetical protein